MMTREEAVERLKRLKRSCRDLAASMPEEPGWALHGIALDMAISALRPVSREQVEQIFRTRDDYLCRNGGVMHPCFYCTSCGYECDDYYSRDESQMPDNQFQFCPCCGKAVTDEAVEMVMERLEALKDGSTTD